MGLGPWISTHQTTSVSKFLDALALLGEKVSCLDQRLTWARQESAAAASHATVKRRPSGSPRRWAACVTWIREFGAARDH